MKIAIINGPNLNLLGRREPHIYGHTTLGEIEATLSAVAKELDIELECSQHNGEGDLISAIHALTETADGIVINASLKQPISLWMEARYIDTFNPIYRNTQIIDFVLVFGSMALITWPPYARLVRAQVLSIRNRPYVTAAKALGLTNSIILRRYVLPNAMGPLVVSVSAGLGTAMVLESAFSFLGVGVTPPTPSWGNMISDGLRVWTNYPHLLVAPAAVLAVVTVAFNFLGDGLRDHLDPRRLEARR